MHRLLIAGLEAFKKRTPYWEQQRAPTTALVDAALLPRQPAQQQQHTYVSGRNGFGLLHQRDRARDSAVGSPAVKQGELYSFSFALVGGGAGCVVGVADANSKEGRASVGSAAASLDVACPSSAGSPSAAPATAHTGGDGSPAAAAWGINLSHGALYTKYADGNGELAPQQLLAIPPVGLVLGRSGAVIIDVEVDMRQRPFRIGFGIRDGPIVQAVAADLDGCERIVPWVHMWGIDDAVVLLPQKQAREPRMQPRVYPSGLALRPAYSSSQRANARVAVSHRQLSHRQPRTPHGGRLRRPSAAGEADLDSALLETSSVTDSSSSNSSTVSAWAPAAASDPRKALSHRQQQMAKTHPQLCTFALSAYEERKQPLRHSPERRPKARSWDIVRRVTSTYSDVYAQLGAQKKVDESKVRPITRPSGNAKGFFQQFAL